MALRDIVTADSSRYAVIDLDTGTIVGTRLVIVDMDGVEESDWEFALDSDSFARTVGNVHGRPIYLED